MSINTQFIQFEEKIVKRYAKTVPHMVTGRRLDPARPENELFWLLKSPEDAFVVEWIEHQPVKLIRTRFSYQDEVIELYSEAEVRMFERWNRATIESGALKIYTDSAPAVDTTNMLSDEEINTIAAIKQLTAFTKRVTAITSVYTLRRVLEAIEKLDRPMSVAKVVQARIDELSKPS